MVKVTCPCGSQFSYTPGLGRQRKWCFECRPSVPSKKRGTCAKCGIAVWLSRSSAADPQCRACRFPTYGEGSPDAECATCGVAFTPRRRSSGSSRWTRCCSKSCAMKLAVAEGRHQFIPSESKYGSEEERLRVKGERVRRRRRARLAEVESEPYTTAEIAERDGHRCGICSRRVRADLKYPHPRSASIDHIVPLSLGGDDLKTNTRLAHLVCNISRGNEMGFAQPLLIG